MPSKEKKVSWSTSLKGLIILLATISLCFALSSCSSDPYENAGECKKPGDSKMLQNRVVVCAGLDNRYKWYFEGKYFEDLKLLAIIEDHSTELESQIYKDLTAQHLWNAFMKQGLGITIEQISNYANGDPRWDGLIEAKARYDLESKTQTYLMGERFRLNGQYRLGKATYTEAYAAQEKQIAHMNGPLEKASNEFDQKLAVLRSELGNTYAIKDFPNLLFFTARQFLR